MAMLLAMLMEWVWNTCGACTLVQTLQMKACSHLQHLAESA